MNENLSIPGPSPNGFVPPAVSMEGASVNPTDSQAFQGVLQTVVESQEETAKATSDATDASSTPSENKGTENAEAMLAMAIALATPPVVFQVVPAPQADVSKERMEGAVLSTPIAEQTFLFDESNRAMAAGASSGDFDLPQMAGRMAVKESSPNDSQLETVSVAHLGSMATIAQTHDETLTPIRVVEEERSSDVSGSPSGDMMASLSLQDSAGQSQIADDVSGDLQPKEDTKEASNLVEPSLFSSGENVEHISVSVSQNDLGLPDGDGLFSVPINAQTLNSDQTMAVDKAQQQQPGSPAAEYLSSIRGSETPIIIRPVDLENPAEASIESGLSMSGELEQLNKELDGKIDYAQLTGSPNPGEFEAQADIVDPKVVPAKANGLTEERLQSKPIDPAVMMGGQFGRQVATQDRQGVAETKGKEVLVPGNWNNAPEPNLKEMTVETAALGTDTNLPKAEFAPEETLPITPTGLVAENVGNSSLTEPVAKTVVYEPREIVNQIVRGTHVMVRDGATQMQIRLDPPELGRVELKIIAEQDGIKAHFLTESQAVKALIEAELPHLRNALQQAGVQADAFSVSVGGRWTQSGNGHAFAGRENHPFYAPNRHYLEHVDEQLNYHQSENGGASWLGRINLKA
jgi:hypothetical protein